jgi:hypothetical protein
MRTMPPKCSRGLGAENGPSRKAGAKIWTLRCMVWHSGVLQSLHIQVRLKQHMFRLVTETGTGRKKKKNLVSDYLGNSPKASIFGMGAPLHMIGIAFGSLPHHPYSTNRCNEWSECPAQGGTNERRRSLPPSMR